MFYTNCRDRAISSSGPSLSPTSGSRYRVKHILAPTDLKDPSEPSVECALYFAKQFEAKLTLFHVWDVSERVGGASGALDFDRVRKDRDHAEQAFYNLYHRTRSRHFATDRFFLAGDPCALVLSAAKTLSIDLIVMARHHRSWVSGLIGRSDIDRIARSVDCPLLMVR
jgi:nucleotide-binding universal stress UspA family protein